MKKVLLALALAVSCMVAHAAQPQVVKIGASLGVTGALAVIGADEQQAVNIAMDELHANPPIINGKPVRIELALYDDESKLDKASIVAEKLNQDGVVAVIANSRSAVTVAMAPMYNRFRIAQLTPNGTAIAFTQFGYDTTFRPLANLLLQSSSLADYAKDLNVRTVATVDNGDINSVGLVAGFEQDVRHTNIVIQSRDQLSGFDFRAIITKLRGQHPDAVLIGGSYDAAAPFIQQSAQMGFKPKFLLGDGACFNMLSDLTNHADLSNVYCVNTDPSEANSGYAKFQAKFKARYGHESGPYAPYAYDSVYLIVEAMKLARSTDREAIIKALHKINYVGVTGRKQFTEIGELANPVMTRHFYKDGVLQ